MEKSALSPSASARLAYGATLPNELYSALADATDARIDIIHVESRYSFSELSALAGEIYWDVSKEHASVEDARRAFARLRHRLRRELDRIGQIHVRK
ncbi:hypothetical protein [Paraburkholderia silvatlantica]|uniref:Uncharacterized protein n=1 Tax=Paraburkholderia silvatlantica TaxID=321895 RepID=A0A2V4TL47_9BURK|nr:hypothetical protein [Paraburkholderia silvatlantica]PYE16113.1 hypothetical protein C7410_13161 [Paraburkholderia silvatlantica]TDQ80369.1 hypothetical protein C7412_12865 [Paraburkholderia silvatlantica]